MVIDYCIVYLPICPLFSIVKPCLKYEQSTILRPMVIDYCIVYLPICPLFSIVKPCLKNEQSTILRPMVIDYCIVYLPICPHFSINTPFLRLLHKKGLVCLVCLHCRQDHWKMKSINVPWIAKDQSQGLQNGSQGSRRSFDFSADNGKGAPGTGKGLEWLKKRGRKAHGLLLGT